MYVLRDLAYLHQSTHRKRMLTCSSHTSHAGEVLMSRSVVDLVREPLESVAYDDFPPVRINGDKTEHDIVLVRQEATRQPVPAG